MLLLLAGCVQRGAMRRQMAVADSLVTVNPDSALLYLERIDTAGLRLSERMHLELMRGKAITRAGNLITTDTVAKRVAAYYDEWPHRDANRRMLAHYYLGMAYRDMGSAIRALEEFQTAASVADTASARCDLPTLMRVHSQISLIFKKQHIDDMEYEENLISESLCWRMGDTISALIFHQDYCTDLYLNEKYEESLAATEQLYQTYLRFGYKNEGAPACINAVRSAIALDDYPTAKKYLDIYETSSLLQTNPNELYGGIAPLYNNKGLYYLGIQVLDSAEYYFRKALQNKGTLESNEIVAFYGLSETYREMHLADSLAKYALLYSESHYRQYRKSNSEFIIQMKSLYDYSVEQKIANEEKAKSVRKGRWIEVLIIVILAVMVAFLYLLYNRNQLRLSHILVTQHLNDAEKRIQELDEIRHRHEETVQQLRQTENTIDMLKKQRDEIKQSHSAQMELLQKQIKGNEDTIILLKRRISQFEQAIQLAETEHTEKQASLSEAKKPFEDYRNDFIHNKLLDKHWAALKKALGETCPTVISLLDKQLSLSEVELRVCMLVLLDYSAKDIDVLLDRKNSFAAKTRQRLLKKVFDMEGNGADFDRKLRLMR